MKTYYRANGFKEIYIDPVTTEIKPQWFNDAQRIRCIGRKNDDDRRYMNEVGHSIELQPLQEATLDTVANVINLLKGTPTTQQLAQIYDPSLPVLDASIRQYHACCDSSSFKTYRDLLMNLYSHYQSIVVNHEPFRSETKTIQLLTLVTAASINYSFVITPSGIEQRLVSKSLYAAVVRILISAIANAKHGKEFKECRLCGRAISPETKRVYCEECSKKENFANEVKYEQRKKERQGRQKKLIPCKDCHEWFSPVDGRYKFCDKCRNKPNHRSIVTKICRAEKSRKD